MAKVVLARNETGELQGLTDADDRAYQRFIHYVAQLDIGQTFSFSWSEPRSPAFHRAHFALIKLIFESQETFSDPEALRAWLTVGAGHCDMLPGPSGELVAVPRSIAYERMDETDFREHHMRVLDFLRSPRACFTLWPNLSDEAAGRSMDQLLLAYAAAEHSQSSEPTGQ